MESLLFNVALLVVIVNPSLTVGASVSNSSRFDLIEDGPNSTLGNGSRGNSSLADDGSSWYSSFHVSNLWEYGNGTPFGSADTDESNATLTVPEVPRNNSLHLTNFLLANESSSSLNPWNTTFNGSSYLLRSNETSNGTASNQTVPESRSLTNVNSWDWNVDLNDTNGSLNSSSLSDGNFNIDGFTNVNSWSWNVVEESNSSNSTFDLHHLNFNVLEELNSSTTALENGTEGGIESNRIRQHWRLDVVEESNRSVATVENNTEETNLSDNFHLFHHLEYDVVDASNGSNAVENEPVTVSEKNQSSHTNFSFNATEDNETLPVVSASLFKTNLNVEAESAIANFTKPGSSQNTTSANETSTSTNGTIEDLRADATPDPDSLLLLLNTDPPFAVRSPEFNEDSHEARENDPSSNTTTSSWLRPWASWFADPGTTSFNGPLSNVSVVDGSNHNGSSNKNQTGNLAAEVPSTGSFWGVGNTFKSFHPWVNWFAGVTTTEIPSEETEANETASPALNVSIRDFRALNLSEQVGAPNANGSEINQNSDRNSTLGFDDHIHDENCDHALDFFDNDTLAVSIEEVDSIEREQRSSFKSVGNSTQNNSLVHSNGDDQRKFFTNFAVVNVSDPVPTPFIVEELMIINLEEEEEEDSADEERFDSRNQRALDINATNFDDNTDNSTDVNVEEIPEENSLDERTFHKFAKHGDKTKHQSAKPVSPKPAHTTEAVKIATSPKPATSSTEAVKIATSPKPATTTEAVKIATSPKPATTTEAVKIATSPKPATTTEAIKIVTSPRPVPTTESTKPIPSPELPKKPKPYRIPYTSQPAPSVFKPKPSKETSSIQKHTSNEVHDNQQPGMEVPLFVDNKHHSHSHQSHDVESGVSEEQRHQYHYVSEIQQPGMSVPVFDELITRNFPALSAYCPTEFSGQPCPEWLTDRNPHCDSDNDCQVEYLKSMCCLVNCRRRCVGNVPPSESRFAK